MKLDSLKKLYIHELKDLWSAEKQILDLLPRLVDAAREVNLAEALRSHERETRTHVDRLEKIFQDLDFEPGGHKCKGMEGLVAEVKDTLADDIDAEVVDAALVAGCQRIEHYEIAGYGVARTFAEKLGDYRAADLLQESLNEEALADQRLTRLAERNINFEAMVSSD